MLYEELKACLLMDQKITIDIRSEVGELEAVIIHPPGPEVENMTPENAERALYSDILNLPVAQREFQRLEKVLNRFTKVFKIKELLVETLNHSRVKEDLVNRICGTSGNLDMADNLIARTGGELADLLIEGVIMEKNNLTRFLSRERYSLPPLHNFFFARDAAVTIGNSVLISKMANKVRERESVILETIFNSSGIFSTQTCLTGPADPSATFEGGDVLIARDDILIVGNGKRTSSRGIDLILELLQTGQKDKINIIVQEIPCRPESFIHLDMVFTILDNDYCMVYEPVIYKTNKYQTVHIIIDNGKVTSIREEKNIPDALKKLGMDLKPIFCGGRSDPWIQEREQWHSGANCFAVAPGKVVGYARNIHTLNEMNRNGFEIISDDEIIAGKKDPHGYKKLMITLEGSELPRGGGGARCMTMPLKRKNAAG
jgi:arginine deiminase